MRGGACPLFSILVPGPGRGAPRGKESCGGPGTWISREASGARAGGLWRRRVAGPALVAGPGAWRSVGGVALGGCQVGGCGKSGSTVPRWGAGRAQDPGKVPSPACPTSSDPSPAAGRFDGGLTPPPVLAPISPLHSALRLLPHDFQAQPRLHFCDPTPHQLTLRPHQVTLSS